MQLKEYLDEAARREEDTEKTEPPAVCLEGQLGINGSHGTRMWKTTGSGVGL